jgi:hypothetical protein
MIKRLAQASTALVFMLAGGGALGSTPELAPEGMSPENSDVFWFSYMAPYEGFGILYQWEGTEGPFVVVNPQSGPAAVDLNDKLLSPMREDYAAVVRYIVNQPVVWGAFLLGEPSHYLFGPAARCVPWRDNIFFSDSPKAIVSPFVYPDWLDEKLFSPCCPLWSPAFSYEGSWEILPNSWSGGLLTSPPLPKVNSWLWVHNGDDSFCFRPPPVVPNWVYLLPQEHCSDIEVPEFARVPVPGESVPALVSLAAVAVGALGLGYSVTKLLI